MANVTEISNFDAGIYQLEITDVVEGGALGVDNYQAKGLANRTRWLYDNIINIFKYVPKNRGFVTNLDLGGSTGAQAIGGDITSASKAVSGSSTILTINLANSMGTTNYDVEVSVHNLSTDLAANTDIFVPTFKPVSANQCQVILREGSGGTQNLKLNIKVTSLD
tara:strand:+ start:1505 stop:1999 length:495 start_codon:yes stop_codon:yes gene_type:complete